MKGVVAAVAVLFGDAIAAGIAAVNAEGRLASLVVEVLEQLLLLVHPVLAIVVDGCVAVDWADDFGCG